jgi:hypothetical protein
MVVFEIANLMVNIVYVLIFAALIIFLDFKYFKNDFLKRLIVNIIIVLIAVAIYYQFLVNLTP